MDRSKKNVSPVSKSLEHFEKFTLHFLNYLGTISYSHFREIGFPAGFGLEAYSDCSLHLGIDVGINEMNEAKKYVEQENYHEALSLFQKALSLYQALYQGEPHPYEAAAIRSIGYCLKKNNAISAMIEHYELALRIEKEFCQKNEKFLEQYQSNLQLTTEEFQAICETDRAKKYADELSLTAMKAIGE